MRTVKYGETSIITSIYTEVFGLQSYIVKGIRQSSKRSSAKAIYFQTGAILELVVYHNEFRNLNFIKEYQWGIIYKEIFFNVIKNTVALYIAEILQHSLKQPEANPELYYLVEDTLKQLDQGSSTFTANLPLYFNLHLAGDLGFKIHGSYSVATPVLDLKEGTFISQRPDHSFFIEGKLAEATAQILSVMFYNDLDNLHFTRSERRELLRIYQNYLALHVNDFGELKSLPVLQELFY